MVKILMIDSLVGNDYTLHLCAHLSKLASGLTLVVTENRKIDFPVAFEVKPWAPTKQKRYSKFKKAIRYIRYLQRVSHLARAGKFDIVHFQFLRRRRMESLFLLWLKIRGIPLAYTVHNVLPLDGAGPDRLFNLLIYRCADVLIVHSQKMKQELQRNFPVKPNRVHTIPHGNFDAYAKGNGPARKVLLKQLNLEPGNFVLLFFGNIKPYKGLDLLLDAFDTCAGQIPELALIIAGNPENKNLDIHYRERIQSSPYKERIRYFPQFIPPEEMNLYFACAHLVILPYTHIYHSGILHLAYSFGKPVIATRVGDFAEEIEHGKCGYVLNRNDVRHLASAIAEAYRNREALPAMGEYVKQISKIRYSWERVAKLTCAAYQNGLRK